MALALTPCASSAGAAGQNPLEGITLRKARKAWEVGAGRSSVESGQFDTLSCRLLLDQARKDARFGAMRQTPEFQRLVPP